MVPDITPVLACQDRVLRVLQVSRTDLSPVFVLIPDFVHDDID